MCIFCMMKSSFGCCYERLIKNTHNKKVLVIFDDELLHFPVKLSAEKKDEFDCVLDHQYIFLK